MEPTHPHGQVENATAPLRLCARFSGSGGESAYHFRTTSSWKSGAGSLSGSMEWTIRRGSQNVLIQPPTSP